MMETRLNCRCGAVQLVAEKNPIITAECHCNSCREAGRRLRALPSAPRLRFTEENGGTRFVLYRKDRVRFLAGTERLKELRLTEKSPTRRVVATCCNTPVFLEFQSGHWLSLYACLWPAGAVPKLELRTMTSDRSSDAAPLPNDVPNARSQSVGFFAKLLGAWIAMGFRAPKIAVPGGRLEA